MPPSFKTRYRYEVVPISKEEAEKERQRTIDNYNNQIDALYFKMGEFIQKPLPTEKTIQISVEPGEDGYDELPDIFLSGAYQGDFEWINHQTSPPTSPKTD